MSLKENEKQSGFTIIEVVLVLAIAGLIFLIVFLALPQLQRSRRDTQRKNDAGRVIANLEQWAANNNGSYPDAGSVNDMDDFLVDYFQCTDIGGNVYDCPELTDPSEGEMTLNLVGSPATISSADAGEMYYATNASCVGQDLVRATANGSREVAVLFHQESGARYCQDNQ